MQQIYEGYEQMVKKHLNPTKIDFIKCVVEGCLLQVRNTNTVDIPDLVEAWSIDILAKDSKNVVIFLRGIQDNDPISFLHAKRIKKLRNGELRVLIGSSYFIADRKAFDDIMRTANFPFTNVKDDNKVPKVGPSTKSLMLKWSEDFWPLIWRGNPNDQVLNDYVFDMDLISDVLHKISEHSQAIKSKDEGRLPVVSAFVNPLDGKILISVDHRHDDSPLDHSIMKGIQMVADEEQQRRERAAGHCLLETDNREDTYLCLNFDVYTTHEPCSMCSMALIHSRVKRCIFVKPMTITGSLRPASGDGYCMHSNKDLNSKYEVFQWVGEELDIPDVQADICC